MVVHTTIKKKPSGTYRASWFYCPVSRTKGPTVCTHRTRYRTNVIEFRLANRAMEAMKPKPVTALVRGGERLIETRRRTRTRTLMTYK